MKPTRAMAIADIPTAPAINNVEKGSGLLTLRNMAIRPLPCDV
jgi:hypothetical protein